jgi:peptidyl-prolyl cis-trans isomerase SurA
MAKEMAAMRPPVPALICICLVAMLATLPVSRPASAQQNPFSAAITVDDRAVTWWELDQRARLLAALNLPGDPERAAREQLIDDRLRANVAERIGYVLPEDELQAELLDFAERGGLDIDQLLVLLDREGVAPETLRDYVRWQVTWRAIVQGRYAGQVQITDEEIDNALALAAAGSGTSVLVSELILPRTPQIAEQNRALAQQLSDTIDSTAAFEAAARRYSVAPSAARGGRLDWLPLSELPPELGSLLLTLAPGDVTEALVLSRAPSTWCMRGEAAALTSRTHPQEGADRRGRLRLSRPYRVSRPSGAGGRDARGDDARRAPTLRVVPVTIHIPLAEVPGTDAAALEDTLRITDAALRRDFG